MVDRLALAARRFLRKDVEWLGAFTEDPELGRVVRHPGGLLGHASAEVDAVALGLIACLAPRDAATAGPPSIAESA